MVGWKYLVEECCWCASSSLGSVVFQTVLQLVPLDLAAGRMADAGVIRGRRGAITNLDCLLSGRRTM